LRYSNQLIGFFFESIQAVASLRSFTWAAYVTLED